MDVPNGDTGNPNVSHKNTQQMGTADFTTIKEHLINVMYTMNICKTSML